jgi:hypothetical protein
MSSSEETHLKLLATLSVFSEYALEDAKRTAAHRGDHSANAEDIVRALKLQAIPSSCFLAHAGLANRAQDHYDAIATGTTPKPRSYAPPTHIDDLLQQMLTVDAEFEAWKPDTHMTRRLKEAIEKTATECLNNIDMYNEESN